MVETRFKRPACLMNVRADFDGEPISLLSGSAVVLIYCGRRLASKPLREFERLHGMAWRVVWCGVIPTMTRGVKSLFS